MEAPAFPFIWNGEAMVPPSAFARRADQTFVVGQHYTMAEVQDRSSASHRHFFALVNEAFVNLPESAAERFSSADHLRKYALIRAGYRDERSTVCSSKAEAQRVAAFIRPMDDYAVVTVSEAVVTVYTAKSQSVKAMGKAEFQASKDAVIDVLAKLIGVAPATLQAQQVPA